ncbi:MAG: hypothetical protein EAX95_10665 [Candidatus Thorarchaeota archaeon]|nr:hypothetical protein [Candidatus Thorarchaeota archaeon]
MKDGSRHKFDEKFEISYRQYLRDRYAGLVAFLRELEEKLGKEQAHQLIGNFYEHGAIEGIKKLVSSQKMSIDKIEDVRKLFQRLDEDPFQSKMQTSSYPESKPGTFRVCITECLWGSVLRELDAADIGNLMFCNTDFATASAIHPNLKLERDKTIMNGDEHCDFVYYWKRK